MTRKLQSVAIPLAYYIRKGESYGMTDGLITLKNHNLYRQIFDLDQTRFDAALVFHDPLDWALDCQLTVGSVMNTSSYVRSKQVRYSVISSNLMG